MIVAGFGFRHGASACSLRDAYDRARGARWAQRLATAEDKAETAAFRALAETLRLPPLAIVAPVIETQITLTHSARVHAARGTGSLAEAAALAAAGPGARLLGPRVLSADRMASCALARSHKGTSS